mgnify:FL=1
MVEVNRDNLKKKDIATNINYNIGIPNTYAELIINDLLMILKFNLKKKIDIKIKNFGSFKLKNKAKRTGRNPKNKKEYDILSRNVITFKASKYLNKKLNFNGK